MTVIRQVLSVALWGVAASAIGGPVAAGTLTQAVLSPPQGFVDWVVSRDEGQRLADYGFSTEDTGIDMQSFVLEPGPFVVLRWYVPETSGTLSLLSLFEPNAGPRS